MLKITPMMSGEHLGGMGVLGNKSLQVQLSHTSTTFKYYTAKTFLTFRKSSQNAKTPSFAVKVPLIVHTKTLIFAAAGAAVKFF